MAVRFFSEPWKFLKDAPQHRPPDERTGRGQSGKSKYVSGYGSSASVKCHHSRS